MNRARCYLLSVFIGAQFHHFQFERVRFTVFPILAFGYHPFPAVTVTAHLNGSIKRSMKA